MKPMQTCSLALVLTFSAVALGEDTIKGEAGKTIEMAYKKTAEKTLNTFTHFPDDWKPSDKRPAIIFFFGGGWTHGTPKQLRIQATYLAKHRHGLLPCRLYAGQRSRCLRRGRSRRHSLVRSAVRGETIDADRIVASGVVSGRTSRSVLGLLQHLGTRRRAVGCRR